MTYVLTVRDPDGRWCRLVGQPQSLPQVIRDARAWPGPVRIDPIALPPGRETPTP